MGNMPVAASVMRGGDAVTVDDKMIARRIDGIDAKSAERDGAEHGKGQKRGFQCSHLGCNFRHCAIKRLRLRCAFAAADYPAGKPVAKGSALF